MPTRSAGRSRGWKRGEPGEIAYLAKRLADQGVLQPDLAAEEAAELLWVLTSFDSFDLLYTGRALAVEEVADRLVDTAERGLLR
jgi:hypothetical protein